MYKKLRLIDVVINICRKIYVIVHDNIVKKKNYTKGINLQLTEQVFTIYFSFI